MIHLFVLLYSFYGTIVSGFLTFSEGGLIDGWWKYLAVLAFALHSLLAVSLIVEMVKGYG